MKVIQIELNVKIILLIHISTALENELIHDLLSSMETLILEIARTVIPSVQVDMDRKVQNEQHETHRTDMY